MLLTLLFLTVSYTLLAILGMSFGVVLVCSLPFWKVYCISELHISSFDMVQIGSKLIKLNQTCSNLFKLVQTCSSLFKLVQTCSNLFLTNMALTLSWQIWSCQKWSWQAWSWQTWSHQTILQKIIWQIHGL